MRWIVIWFVGAVILAFGVLTVYFGPAWSFGGKREAPLLPPQVLPTLLVGGVLALAAGGTGVWRTFTGSPRAKTHGARIRFADFGAPVGLIAAALALLAVLSVFLVPSIVQLGAGADPCMQDHTPACFSEHPAYYQPWGPGADSWSTPASRTSQVVGPFFLLAWPVARAGALISLFALISGTARRRLAVSGLVLGSAVAIGQVLMELVLLVGGGD
jgi:hypothetical protein